MKLKKIIKSFLPPLIAGVIGGLFVAFGKIDYNSINKPPFSPEKNVFMIVWPILYLLISISTYLYLNSKNGLDETKSKGIVIYYLDMFFNSMWTFFYFYLGYFLFSSIWLAVLIIIVASRIYLYFKINKLSGLINVIYFIWLSFALYLNFSTFLLN